MQTELRKVEFSLGHESFSPDEKEQKEIEELARKRFGYFHRWVEIEEQSAQSGRFREKTVALVEEVDTGKMYYVEVDFIHFTQLLMNPQRN